MNLNFIQDNDLVHVETQNQITYKQEIILKMQLLREDFKDYSQINPNFTQINALFSNIVNDLFEHVTNFKNKTKQKADQQTNQPILRHQNAPARQKKKNMSMNYGTIKKFQLLKQKFISCRKIIQAQNIIYRSINRNRQNQKSSQVKFYKQMLNSYEQQRQYFKKQTLELQNRIQEVETQVKKVAAGENHKYTDYTLKIIQFESVVRYRKKMGALEKVKQQLYLLKKIKFKIANSLEKSQEKGQNQQKNKGTQVKTQIKTIPFGKTVLRSIVDIEKKVCSLKMQKCQIINNTIYSLQQMTAKSVALNQRLKKSILQSENKKYFLSLQSSINQKKSKKTQNLKKQKQKQKQITKTDYLIYLRQLNCQVKDHFKTKQIMFRCKNPVKTVSKKERSKSLGYLE